jgi:hypothetical protein
MISCTLDFVHGGTVMSMLSLSLQYVNEGAAADHRLYQVVGAAVASARRWAHYTQLFAIIAGWLFVFYSSLFRFNLIPRALAVVGLIGIALQLTGVTIRMFMGYSVIGEMAIPMGPIQLAIALWLIVKGFNERLAEPTAEPIFE